MGTSRIVTITDYRSRLRPVATGADSPHTFLYTSAAVWFVWGSLSPLPSLPLLPCVSVSALIQPRNVGSAHVGHFSSQDSACVFFSFFFPRCCCYRIFIILRVDDVHFFQVFERDSSSLICMCSLIGLCSKFFLFVFFVEKNKIRKQ